MVAPLRGEDPPELDIDLGDNGVDAMDNIMFREAIWGLTLQETSAASSSLRKRLTYWKKDAPTDTNTSTIAVINLE